MGRSGQPTEIELVGAIYEAALHRERWPEVVEALTGYLGGVSALVIVLNLRELRAPFKASNTGLDAKAKHAYDTHYCLLDPAGARHLMSQPEGTASATNQLLTPREHEESEFYQDYLRVSDIFHHAGATLMKQGSQFAMLGIHRSRRMGGFTPRDLERLRGLVPHLRRALLIDGRTSAWQAGREALADLLERLPLGVVLLDDGERVLWASRRAQEIASRNPELRLGAAGLEAARPADARVLRGLIHGAVQTGAGRGVHPGGALALHRDAHAQPLRLVVTPLRTTHSEAGFGPASACAAVFVSEPEAQAQPDPALLQALFGLTAAEAVVAGALAEGDTPEQIAQRRAKSVRTVRNQVQSVYDKLGVQRQGELARLILHSPAALLGPPREE